MLFIYSQRLRASCYNIIKVLNRLLSVWKQVSTFQDRLPLAYPTGVEDASIHLLQEVGSNLDKAATTVRITFYITPSRYWFCIGWKTTWLKI